MKLAEVIPWGRSFEEYREMFALTRKDLHKSILGCGDGPASFNAELAKKGGRVISVDPLYTFSSEQIEQRIQDVCPIILEQMTKDAEQYIWRTISDPGDLANRRLAAMNLFLDDYTTGKEEGRYIPGALPKLPFADKSFSLALCSHYLFLYTEQTSLNHHVYSILELCRIAEEVRVYPLLTLENKSSRYISPVIEKLSSRGYATQKVRVTYQFQKGASEMLVTRQKPSTWQGEHP